MNTLSIKVYYYFFFFNLFLALLGPYYMGQDRAFRSYYFMHFLNLIVVEEPDLDQLKNACDNSSSLKNSEFHNVNLFGCAEKNSLKSSVHRPAWKCKISQFLYFLEEDGIEKVLIFI